MLLWSRSRLSIITERKKGGSFCHRLSVFATLHSHLKSPFQRQNSLRIRKQVNALQIYFSIIFPNVMLGIRPYARINTHTGTFFELSLSIRNFLFISPRCCSFRSQFKETCHCIELWRWKTPWWMRCRIRYVCAWMIYYGSYDYKDFSPLVVRFIDHFQCYYV